MRVRSLLAYVIGCVCCTWGTFNAPDAAPAPLVPWIGSWSISGTADWGGPTSVSGPAYISEAFDDAGAPVATAVDVSINGCNLQWNVSGNSGTLQGGQSCGNSQVGSVSLQSSTWTSGSANLDASATPTIISIQMAGTACCASSQQITETLTLTQTAP